MCRKAEQISEGTPEWDDARPATTAVPFRPFLVLAHSQPGLLPEPRRRRQAGERLEHCCARWPWEARMEAPVVVLVVGRYYSGLIFGFAGFSVGMSP